MEDYTEKHSLIDYMMLLLGHPEYNGSDSGLLSKKAVPASFGTDQDIRIAHEVINFMDEMPGGFLIYHADGDEQIIYANKALLRIFHCETLKEFQELTGNSFRGIVYSEDLEAVEQSIKEQVAASQYDLDYVEYRIICRDGSLRWIEDYGHYLHVPSVGNIFYVFMADATEKKIQQQTETFSIINEKDLAIQNLIKKLDNEKNLNDQEYLRRLEVIEGLSINYESILYADLDTNKILPYRLSRRTQSYFGQKFQVRDFLRYTSDYINTWVHPEDRKLLSEASSPEYIRRKLSSSKTFYTNYKVLHGDEVQYLQLRIVNVGGGNHISQIVLGYRRVDEEIRRGMEQKQMLEAALHNAKLAIIAKNTFLSNMSHDMRTPLNAIFGFTDLAQKHIDDRDALQSYLNKISASGRLLLDLINKVLEISWTESRDIHIDESECNLKDIMQAVHKSLSRQASEKNITFSMNCSQPEHSDVYSDQDKLKQLLLYVVNNAVTYTEPGGNVDFSVTEQELLPNGYAVYQFIVKDNGIGISDTFRPHIFEPFEREQNTTSSGIHGIGLGLTIAKSIVDMMEGSIDINSTVGLGSTFTITLRFRIQDQPALPSGSSRDTIFLPQGQKILLVEDNEINVEIETEILNSLGFYIDTAENGSIAVEKVKNSKPGDYALILMDIQMPVMDGREAAAAIRRLENPLLSRIPIIALSADAFESDKQKSIESGMNAHLTKPIDVPLLTETISRFIRESANTDK